MFTLNSLLSHFEESGKLTFEGEHYESGEAVYTGDLWRLWPDPSGLESVKHGRLRDLMEKRNMQLRFYDETITDDNGKVHERIPGYHGEVATYRILGDNVWSQGEGQEEHTDAYIEALLEEPFENRSDRWLSDKQLTERGFVKFDYDAESGFHRGQTDTPDSTVDRVKAQFPTATDFIFRITDVGQFDMGWNVWYRLEESK